MCESIWIAEQDRSIIKSVKIDPRTHCPVPEFHNPEDSKRYVCRLEGSRLIPMPVDEGRPSSTRRSAA